jgi:ribonuclease-3
MRAAEWSAMSLGYRFEDPKLLEAALTHRSVGTPHNERLEFLGDAFLNYVIAEELFRRERDAQEGDLSRLRALLVRRETLAEIAATLGLGEQLKLGPGELKTGGFRRASILADALEAVFGALLLDGGAEPCRERIVSLYAERLARLPPAAELKDPKTRLQEYLQARGMGLPEYAVTAVEGKPHRQRFVVSCRVEGMDVEAHASAGSRRRAEQEAAEKVFATLTRRG